MCIYSLLDMFVLSTWKSAQDFLKIWFPESFLWNWKPGKWVDLWNAISWLLRPFFSPQVKNNNTFLPPKVSFHIHLFFKNISSCFFCWETHTICKQLLNAHNSVVLPGHSYFPAFIIWEFRVISNAFSPLHPQFDYFSHKEQSKESTEQQEMEKIFWLLFSCL